jgi:hypothetical protein
MSTPTPTADGLATSSELRPSSYLWFVSIFLISSSMAYFFHGVDGRLWGNKNKFVDPDEHRENRMSSTFMPNTNHDARGKAEFSDAVNLIAK